MARKKSDSKLKPDGGVRARATEKVFWLSAPASSRSTSTTSLARALIDCQYKKIEECKRSLLQSFYQLAISIYSLVRFLQDLIEK